MESLKIWFDSLPLYLQLILGTILGLTCMGIITLCIIAREKLEEYLKKLFESLND